MFGIVRTPAGTRAAAVAATTAAAAAVAAEAESKQQSSMACGGRATARSTQHAALSRPSKPKPA